jgi:hypothetical protein
MFENYKQTQGREKYYYHDEVHQALRPFQNSIKYLANKLNSNAW